MRDDFSGAVKRALATRVAYRCSNPDCQAVTAGPEANPLKYVNLGVASHINAASPGGPRFDASLSPDERRHPDNGIWLCQNCGKLVDSDPRQYPRELLLRWKAIAEGWTASALGRTGSHLPPSEQLTGPEIELLVAASDDGEIYLLPSQSQSVDQWVRVGDTNFVDESDPAVAAFYRDGLDALCERRLARHESGCLYRLRGLGFKVGRTLKQAIDHGRLKGA